MFRDEKTIVLLTATVSAASLEAEQDWQKDQTMKRAADNETEPHFEVIGAK